MNSRERHIILTLSLQSASQKAVLFLWISPLQFSDTFCSAYIIHTTNSPVITEISKPTAVFLQCSSSCPASRHYPHCSTDYLTLLSSHIVVCMVQLVAAANSTPPSLPRVPPWSCGCLWSWLVSSRWCYVPGALLCVFLSWVCLAARRGREQETMAERWDWHFYAAFKMESFRWCRTFLSRQYLKVALKR